MNLRSTTTNRGYQVSQEQGVLRITIAKDLGDISESTEWATTITAAAIGPFERILIDVTRMPTLASTTIAGLIQIQDAYRQGGTTEIVLVGCNDRARRTLEMMKISDLFLFANAA